MDGTEASKSNNNLTRRVMVVAEPTRESAGALQYALYHAIIDKDELILIHVINSSTARNRQNTLSLSSSLSSFFEKQPEIFTISNVGVVSTGGGAIVLEGDLAENTRGEEFLEVMKKACEAKHPKMKVRVDKVEQGRMDKGTVILCRTMLLSVDLLIIGQRRNLSSVLLGPRRTVSPMLGGSIGSKGIDTADFLIENCTCTCVGVQKKGQNGGYLLNTKTHRNFWLLA